MSLAPFVLVTLSRRRCGDLGQIFGTHRVVAHKLMRRMQRVKLPARMVARNVSGGRMRVLDGRSSMTLHPGVTFGTAYWAVS